MGMESGPSFYEGDSAASEIARAELLVDLATERAKIIGEGVSTEIASRPELDAMMSKLIECGSEMDPPTKTHLRRMASLWIRTHIEAIVAAESDVAFYRGVIQEIPNRIRRND